MMGMPSAGSDWALRHADKSPNAAPILGAFQGCGETRGAKQANLDSKEGHDDEVEVDREGACVRIWSFLHEPGERARHTTEWPVHTSF